MPKTIVKKLYSSLEELEGAVREAKRSFTSVHAGNVELLERVNYYEEVLVKQKALVSHLSKSIEEEKWEEVSRYVRLLNGLSALVHDDAKTLMLELVSVSNEPIHEALSQ